MKKSNKKSILIVDDTKINIDILLELLDETYDILVSLNGKRALEIVEEHHIDLILLDILMPDINGYDVCKVLKAQENTKNIPVIFITANTDEESVENAYEAGGIDYVTKPFKASELLARIKTQLSMQTLIKELEESHKELELLASQDPMTELYNRRYYAEISHKIIELSRRNKKPLSLLMLDIDKFKNINDTYGHHIGDEVIIALAKTLKKYSRKCDVVCRFGGEEFLILLPETSADGAFHIAEKIRESVASMSVALEQNQSVSFTVSAGVSEFRAEEEETLEHTLQRADAGLYEAKESGRNRVCKN